MDREALKRMIAEILAEESGPSCPVKLCRPAEVCMTEADRLETGDPAHRVYTHDLLTLEQSPRLGCGIMKMERTTFPWTLQYDEIDYVISGQLTVRWGQQAVTANAGEVIFIPKGSSIRFSVPDQALFLYVTCPADWKNQS